MRTITRNFYVADDGVEFDTKEECEDYEATLQKTREARKQKIDELNEQLDALETSYFKDYGIYPSDEDLANQYKALWERAQNDDSWKRFAKDFL